MKKLQFLCGTHRQWLASNPRAAVNAWREAYYRGIDLAEDEDYVEATRHAGAAFETAELVLSHPWRGPVRITHFTDTVTLLVRLLHQLKEPCLAATVLGSAISRLERLLTSSETDRQAALAGCSRMQLAADEITTLGRPLPATGYLLAEGALQILH
ncbi:MAG: hypothetical protein GY764_02995 [Halieaceae bacterium]|nr:hypothetical protein [Halieaceae bacterium]MCP4468299.1 hypothetical protein [Halieaceae bacterium]MDG2410502.1 hypothetical protein [Halioglobus sp.]